MADISEAIKRLTYQFTSDGADKVAADMGKVNEAGAKLSTGSIGVNEANLSLDKSFGSLERRYVSTIRQQQDYAKVQDQVKAAVQQNPALMERGNAILAEAALRYGQAGTASRAFAAATSGVSAQLIALSAGAGPVGVFLSALGPWGIAGAAAIGLITAAFEAVSENAHKFAASAVELSRFAETTGLTVIQIKALSRAAAEHGVASEEAIRAVEKFTVAWEEMRNGGGALLEQVRKVDAGLANDMQRTRDSAVALDLLTQAIHRADEAGNISQRNALARAAGGRGGVAGFIGLSGAIAGAGGTNNLVLDQDRIFSPEEIERARKLKTEIDEIHRRTDDYKASLASIATLETEKQFALQMERIAKAASELANAKPDASLWERMFKSAGEYMQGGMHLIDAPKTLGEELRGQGLPSVAYPQPMTVPLPGAAPEGLKASAVANQWKEYVSALGSAATASDRLKAKQADLFAQLDDKKITLDTYNKAMAGETFQVSMQALTARIGLLGQMAPVTDLVTAAQYRLVEAQKQGARFSPEEKAKLAELTRERALGIDTMKAQTDAYNVEAATLGMATGKAVEYAAVQNKINEALRTGQKLTTEDIAQIRSQAAVMGQAAQRTDDMKFALDTYKGVFSDTLHGIQQGKTVWESFQQAGVNALNKISDKLLDMALNNLWGNAFGGGSGGGGGLFSLLGLRGGSGGGVATTSAGIDPSLLVTAGHTGGIVGNLSMQRHVHPAYFDDAPRFHSGGLVGGEVPIIAKQGEEIGWPSQLAKKYGAAAPSSFTIHLSLDNDMLRAVVRDESGAQIATAAPRIVNMAVNKSSGQVSTIAAAAARQQQLRGTRPS